MNPAPDITRGKGPADPLARKTFTAPCQTSTVGRSVLNTLVPYAVRP